MKPLIKYRGGKSKEIHHLIKHAPQFNGRYIEPFFGGGVEEGRGGMVAALPPQII